MKRVEMIEVLNDLLESSGKHDIFGKRVFATQILDLLEQKGMLPPPYAKSVKDGEYYTFVNEWEPEDEQRFDRQHP